MTYDNYANSRRLGNPVTLYQFRGDESTEYHLENMIRSVAIGPGGTEFGYGTTAVIDGSGVSQNSLSNSIVGTDFRRALDQIMTFAPGLEHVALVVAWHGTDLRMGECKIKPKVEVGPTRITTPYAWRVGPVTRDTADVVSQVGGKPAFGGAPADRAVYEALVEIKARGLRATLHPIVLMDIGAGNTLPDPYSNNAATTGQPRYPWRGRITLSPAAGYTGSPDVTSDAQAQIDAFFGAVTPGHFGWDNTNKIVTYSGAADEWSYRRFILHMATIAANVPGGIDDFLIGSELVGVTTARRNGADGNFPSVAALVALAGYCDTIFSSGVRLSYGADWTEYHGYHAGSSVFFHLDPLWGDSRIGFVGINNFMPIADWRDGKHVDLYRGWRSTYDIQYLRSNIEGGEHYAWRYADDTARDAQARTAITDGAPGKPWVFRMKDIRSWWSEDHYNRPSGAEAGSPTDWIPESKPIVFTALGCPAIDKGANQPSAIPDAKQTGSVPPHYSTGERDAHIQRAVLEAWLTYWSAALNPESGEYSGRMIEMDSATIWAWDARPFPTFPKRADVWSDVVNWDTGVGINGRLQRPVEPIGSAEPYAYTDATREVVHNGVTYLPIPITMGGINSSGKLDKTLLEVRMPRDTPVTHEFRVYPPSQPVSLVIRTGHTTDPDDEFLVAWAGRVLGSRRDGDESIMECEPITSSLRRPGLRRNYQIGCPYVLYGPGCKAGKPAATVTVAVTTVDQTALTLTLPDGWEGSFTPEKFIGGMVEWDTDAGTREIRKIMRVEADVLTIGGFLRGLENGDSVSVVLGCNRQTTDCADLHNNIHNYGGFPSIPITNPLGAGTNNYY